MAKEAEGVADLVELVAAAAVTCEDKGTYIQRIMTLSEDSQVEMKAVLQEALQRDLTPIARQYLTEKSQQEPI